MERPDPQGEEIEHVAPGAHPDDVELDPPAPQARTDGEPLHPVVPWPEDRR